MTDPMISALGRLLETSLLEWKLTGDARANSDNIALNCQGIELTITRAPSGMPFRWVVIVDGRRRTAASVNGVLRIVRQTLAPGYEPLSLRIAPLPPPHSPATPRAVS